MAAIQPDRSMGATVVLWDAKGGHSISCHPGETVPFSIHMAVTYWLVVRTIDLVVCVPPGFIQTDVGRAWVKDWKTERKKASDDEKPTFYTPEIISRIVFYLGQMSKKIIQRPTIVDWRCSISIHHTMAPMLEASHKLGPPINDPGSLIKVSPSSGEEDIPIMGYMLSNVASSTKKYIDILPTCYTEKSRTSED